MEKTLEDRVSELERRAKAQMELLNQLTEIVIRVDNILVDFCNSEYDRKEIEK